MPRVRKALTVAYSLSDGGALQMGMTVELWSDGFSLVSSTPLVPGHRIAGSLSAPDGKGTIPFAGVVQAAVLQEAHVHLATVGPGYRSLAAQLVADAGTPAAVLEDPADCVETQKMVRDSRDPAAGRATRKLDPATQTAEVTDIASDMSRSRPIGPPPAKTDPWQPALRTTDLPEAEPPAAIARPLAVEEAVLEWERDALSLQLLPLPPDQGTAQGARPAPGAQAKQDARPSPPVAPGPLLDLDSAEDEIEAALGFLGDVSPAKTSS